MNKSEFRRRLIERRASARTIKRPANFASVTVRPLTGPVVTRRAGA